jgi:hypothetical protein
MKFKKIEFSDKNALRVYEDYMKRIAHMAKPIPEADKQDVLMEFNSHIYEHLQNKQASKSELDILLNILDKLGAPEEILKPLLADKLLDKATKTFNPFLLFKALLLNLGNGLSYIIFFLLYILLGGFIFLIIAKITNSNVGMYYKDEKFEALGMLKNTEGYQEVLGHWFIPVILICLVVVYTVLTLLLRLKKSFNKTISAI